MNAKRPTIRDVAKLVGVSHVTVSLALRKHPKIPLKTREKILKIAEKIGYVPDPVLSALMAYRKQSKPQKHETPLAWINTFQNPADLFKNSVYKKYHEGASERCSELGYRLEEFRLTDVGMSFRRLSKVLLTRNIQGVLWFPMARLNTVVKDFAWEHFSSVAFGFSLAKPQLHTVCSTQFRAARLAVKQIRSMGYRRIGCLAENRNLNERTDYNFLGGFLAEQIQFPQDEQLPLFSREEANEYRKNLCEWYQKYSPDIILDFSIGFVNMLQLFKTSKWLKCAFACHDLPEEPLGLAGIHQNDRLVGYTAVNEVVAMIHTNERGIPKIPKRILIEARWIDGQSAPRKIS